MKTPIMSLQKGLNIIRFFDFDNEYLSAQAISQRLGIPLSTTYRYLETLEEGGFLTRNVETRKYALGFMLFHMGNVVASKMELPDVVIPHMKKLSSISGETVFLTVLSGLKSVCIEKVETQNPIRLSLERGSMLPLHAGASSKVLLAYQKESFIDSILQKAVPKKFTDHTIHDPILLRKELKRIREQGFAFSDQEVNLGARAVSAPVFDHKGRILAGLTVAGPCERINDGNKNKLANMVKDSARMASHDLGYRKTR